MDKAIAIIGTGARFPGSPGLAAYRRTMWGGRIVRRPVPPEGWDCARIDRENPRHANGTPARLGGFALGRVREEARA